MSLQRDVLLCGQLFKREFRLAWRRPGDMLQSVVFFSTVVCLFPLGLGAEPMLLRQIGPGIIWIAVLLSALLSVGRLFADDFRDGTLEQLLLSPCPLWAWVLTKVLAHTVIAGGPLWVMAPLLGLQFDLSPDSLLLLCVTLLLGTPTISMMSGIGAALTLQAQAAGALLAVLVLPLLVPLLIFGTSAVQDFGLGLSVDMQLYMLAAMMCLAFGLGPWCIGLALRVALES